MPNITPNPHQEIMHILHRILRGIRELLSRSDFSKEDEIIRGETETLKKARKRIPSNKDKRKDK